MCYSSFYINSVFCVIQSYLSPQIVPSLTYSPANFTTSPDTEDLQTKIVQIFSCQVFYFRIFSQQHHNSYLMITLHCLIMKCITEWLIIRIELQVNLQKKKIYSPTLHGDSELIRPIHSSLVVDWKYTLETIEF